MAATDALLSGMKVLDLADDKGYLCGRMLGEAGAEVIKIEPPSGDSGRSIGPFYHDKAGPETSLSWFAYNYNKKSITLNLESSDGKEIFRRLLQKWDVVIESFAPGYLQKLGLGYAGLSKVNPRVILASISPYGQEGPYRDYKATDIELMAMGGFMSTCGEPGRAPVRIPLPQAYLFAGAEAAVAILTAYYWRETSGEGQQLDVAAEHSVAPVVRNPGFWIFSRKLMERDGEYRTILSVNVRQRHLYPCKDGWLSFQVIGGQAGAKTNRALVQYMDSKGYATDFLRAMQWEKFDLGSVNQDVMDQIEGPIAKFFLAHTKKELEEESLKRDIILFPVCNMGDILDNGQLKARNFWTPMEHPELNEVINYPGPFVVTSDPALSPIIRQKAPGIGEHNEEIYLNELGFTREEYLMLKQAGII